jgi:hypothetical protein
MTASPYVEWDGDIIVLKPGWLSQGVFGGRVLPRRMAKDIAAIEKEGPLRLTREEREELLWTMFAGSPADERREALSSMDECPCCGRWLGHNRPPGDAALVSDHKKPRRQSSFDFEE